MNKIEFYYIRRQQKIAEIEKNIKEASLLGSFGRRTLKGLLHSGPMGLLNLYFMKHSITSGIKGMGKGLETIFHSFW